MFTVNFRHKLIITNFEKKRIIIIGNVRHLLHNYKGDVSVLYQNKEISLDVHYFILFFRIFFG